MLRVDSEGVLIIDRSDYSSVDVFGLRPDEDITMYVISGEISVDYPLDSFFYRGDSVTFRTDDYLRITAYGSDNPEDNVARILLTYDLGTAEVNLYEQEAIVPAAVSSELDDSGEERIHIAPYEEEVIPGPYVPPEIICPFIRVTNRTNGPFVQTWDMFDMPPWFVPGETSFVISFPDLTGPTQWAFFYDSENDRYYTSDGEPYMPPLVEEGAPLLGEIAENVDGDLQWQCVYVNYQ